MLSPITEAKIYDHNAVYYGYPLEELMENAGKGVAKELMARVKKGDRIIFLCGPGNNGGDGLVAARYLLENGFYPIVFLIPSQHELKSELVKKNWDFFQGEKYDGIKREDIPEGEVIVECLFGTGISGELKEPYSSMINKLDHLKAKKISVDLPTPGYKEDVVLSLMTPKTRNAVTVDIGYPEWLKRRVGPGEIRSLEVPASNSHKGENGQLLIFAGNEKYHGAMLLAARIASKIVDLVFVVSSPENREVLHHAKSELAEFISLPEEEWEEEMKRMDAVLVGPGCGVNDSTRKTVEDLLTNYDDKRIILDADALKVLKPEWLHGNCVLTPHQEEFQYLFGCEPSEENLARISQKYGECVILLKGETDYLVRGEEVKENIAGNAGMTKGGTGDVLAGLVAALATRNDIFLAARAAAFLNGRAADTLAERVSYYYNASDLVEEIPKTLKYYSGS